MRFSATPGKQLVAFNVGWPFENKRGRSGSFGVHAGKTITLRLTEDEGIATASDDSKVPFDSRVQFLTEFPELQGVKLATPHVPAGLRSLRGPGHPLLSHETIVRPPANMRVIAEGDDAEGDDKGPGTFVYPQTPHLRPGSLDIRGARVSADDSLLRVELRFTSLSNPGWHPEYGFQLTTAAIAVDVDGSRGTGTRTIGRNAESQMPSERGYEYIVFVGGGIRIEDQRGSVLAEYLPRPEDASRPFGDAARGVVAFNLPLSLFKARERGEIGAWRFDIFVGAQDDHGGAGIGDFRNVERVAGEWVGGGKRAQSEGNVYDRMSLSGSTRP